MLPSAEDVEKVAGEQSSADLYHWSTMMWGEHWRQQLSLELARGQVDLMLGAVSVAWSSLARAWPWHVMLLHLRDYATFDYAK